MSTENSTESSFGNAARRRPPDVKKPDNSSVPLSPTALRKIGHDPRYAKKDVDIDGIILDPMISAFLFSENVYSGQREEIESELKILAANGTILPLQVFMWCEVNLSQLVQEFNMLPHGDDIDLSLEKSNRISMYALIHSVILKAWDVQASNNNPGWEIIIK
jgi:hypothetical protein